MNIKRALRIAQEEPWFKSFVGYIDKHQSGGSSRYFKKKIIGKDFLRKASL